MGLPKNTRDHVPEQQQRNVMMMMLANTLTKGNTAKKITPTISQPYAPGLQNRVNEYRSKQNIESEYRKYHYEIVTMRNARLSSRKPTNE